MEDNEKYMNVAIEEAKKGEYNTWTDPLVGCVIVKDGKILSEGAHYKFGEDHALVDAMQSLNEDQIAGSSLYLTMEPCDDCTQKIMDAGFTKVVVGQADPHPAKANKNNTKIGVDGDNTAVVCGVLTNEVEKLNQHYNYFAKTGKPWISLKQNLSLDHHVSPANGKYVKLPSQEVRDYIHHERADYQAILIGSSTAIIDNPNLGTDVETNYSPIRIIVDRRGRLLNNTGLNLLNNGEFQTWILTQNSNVDQLASMANVKVFQLKTDKLEEIITLLSEQGIQSAYVEGGPTLEKAFMDEPAVNEIIDYFSPVYLGDIGLPGAVPIHEVELADVSVKKIDDHVRIAGIVKSKQKGVLTHG